MPGPANENIFQARLVDGHAFDLAGKSFHDVSDEAMAAFNFQAHLVSENGRDVVGNVARYARPVQRVPSPPAE